MNATLKLKNARVANVGDFSVLLGEEFVLALSGTWGRVSWSADNDEVLAIDDDGGDKAKIKATAIGRSLLTLRSAHRVLEIRITVFDQGAVTLGGSIGPETPDA